ncbi:uncharacterized protein LOC114270499 [Camellia sinensis]|uniref:uncharacterized protein LOC114270499 n=1 Tax=Camellia sinensis TaxID=4442 RepID=UPI001036CB14|nr:uncharacterized protein LOC114270499 [Camellia sinensis]
MAFPPCMITWIKACITSPSFSICINGSLQGYFKGARGLRQGDPMSPYLFVLAMEILARILAEKSRSPLFKFHWRCEKTKIVNLCFADDLMIFSKGDPGTVSLIMQGLDEFRNLSGLTPNSSKSNIFFSGCSSELKENILRIANFTEGSLPVKYLGVPLITTKLKASDCHTLVERITKRIKSWTNKLLSYAGRAQLIQSILFSMQVYWSSLFILPKKIIGDIESLLRSFLWSGVELKKHSAKIAWRYICRGKNEGGLGFKDLATWNKAAIAKHVWYLFSGGDCSMWCQWVKAYLLKGRSFWAVRTPSDPSWVWRKILSLRHLIYPHIKFKIGNGENVFLWYDNWHPLGSLWHRFGPRILYDTNLPDSTKVSSIVSNGSCKWPISNSWEIKEWISSTPLSFLPSFGSSDTPFWNLAADGDFSIQSAWDCWRDKGPKVTWIWGGILAKSKSNWPSLPWLETVDFAVRSISGTSLKMVILKLSFLCTVYHIWIERNSRIFNKAQKPEEVVTNSIIQMVRGRLLSLENVKISAGDNWLLEEWSLPLNLLQQHHTIAAGRRMSDVILNPKSSPTLMCPYGGLSAVLGAFKYNALLILSRYHVHLLVRRCGAAYSAVAGNCCWIHGVCTMVMAAAGYMLHRFGWQYEGVFSLFLRAV